MQADDDNQLHAVKYGSFATTPHQMNYSTDDLEAVALMYALKSVESLALVRHTTVITDNSHVLHIHDWTPLNNRQRRMISYISQFNLTVRFIKGSRNLLADALSRLYQDSSIQERAEHEAKYVHEVDDFILPVTTRAAHRAALQREEATRKPPQAVISQDGPDAAPQQPREPTSDARVADSNLSDPQDTSSDPATELNTVSESVEPNSKTVTDETDDNDESPVEFPVISPVDFESDDEFGNMYKYLTREELTGHSRTDKTTLIMADRYVIESGLLYRIDIPRQKRLRHLKPVTTRLCVPKRFRHEILAHVHNRCGHYAAQALFHTLAARYFWKKTIFRCGCLLYNVFFMPEDED